MQTICPHNYLINLYLVQNLFHVFQLLLLEYCWKKNKINGNVLSIKNVRFCATTHALNYVPKNQVIKRYELLWNSPGLNEADHGIHQSDVSLFNFFFFLWKLIHSTDINAIRTMNSSASVESNWEKKLVMLPHKKSPFLDKPNLSIYNLLLWDRRRLTNC